METLAHVTADLHKNGVKIGITHGAFDLFHEGHLDLLLKSSNVCDFLIVGVESDEHVKQYKTYGRPIISQDYRMQIVSELGCVDCVFLNDSISDSAGWTELYKRLNVSVVTIGRYFGYFDVIKKQVHDANARLYRFQTSRGGAFNFQNN